MIRYAAYDPATGAITRTGSCQESDLELQGPCIVSETADDALHYIVDGAVLELPPRPTRTHAWEGPDVGWVDRRTLAQAKASAWETVKGEREQRLLGTFTHAGSTYDIDPTNLSGASIDAREALIADEAGWTQAWVLSDNTTVTLTAAEMIAVGRACKAAVSDLWATSQYLRGMIDAATTVEEVDAVVWPES